EHHAGRYEERFRLAEIKRPAAAPPLRPPSRASFYGVHQRTSSLSLERASSTTRSNASRGKGFGRKASGRNSSSRAGLTLTAEMITTGTSQPRECISRK